MLICRNLDMPAPFRSHTITCTDKNMYMDPGCNVIYFSCKFLHDTAICVCRFFVDAVMRLLIMSSGTWDENYFVLQFMYTQYVKLLVTLCT